MSGELGRGCELPTVVVECSLSVSPALSLRVNRESTCRENSKRLQITSLEAPCRGAAPDIPHDSSSSASCISMNCNIYLFVCLHALGLLNRFLCITWQQIITFDN